MAATVIPAPFGRAKPTHAELARTRAALIIRIDVSAEKAKWSREPESAGMPHRLSAAGCYLAAHGFEEMPCAGERWFNTNSIAYAALASAEMIEDGRRAIYEGGCRAIAPAQVLEIAA